MPSDPVFVTGASGFVGRSVMAALRGAGRSLSLAGDDWESVLREPGFAGATIIHAGARVHEPGGREDLFFRDNVVKTEALARSAAHAGATRLVLVSSIKVLGEESRRPLAEDAPVAPFDAYARSKKMAEEVLAKVAGETGLATVVVRPPLVYGAGAGGNLAALRRICDSPWPLPFGALDNRRSWVHVDDLAELLVDCTRHPAAPGRTFHAAHARAIGTRELASGMRECLGRPPRLVAVPAAALEAAAALVGKAHVARRLTRSLEIDAGAATRTLGWVAKRGPEQGISDLARTSH